jgi:GNAT superfamily N-acetyltransferase
MTRSEMLRRAFPDGSPASNQRTDPAILSPPYRQLGTRTGLVLTPARRAACIYAAGVVRAMATGDIPAVQGVEVLAGERFRTITDLRIASCADHPPMSAVALQRFIDGDAAWVATALDGRVVGFLVGRHLDGGSHLEEVAVLPDHGGRGVATSLLDTMLEWTRKNSLPRVTLTTFRDVPWNRPFYERRGFHCIPVGELSAVLDALLDEEEHFGLHRELRVVMVRDV